MLFASYVADEISSRVASAYFLTCCVWVRYICKVYRVRHVKTTPLQRWVQVYRIGNTRLISKDLLIYCIQGRRVQGLTREYRPSAALPICHHGRDLLHFRQLAHLLLDSEECGAPYTKKEGGVSHDPRRRHHPQQRGGVVFFVSSPKLTLDACAP